MRSIPKGVVALVIAGLLGTVVAVGCASAPEDDIGTVTKKKTSKSGTEPEPDDDDDDDDLGDENGSTDKSPSASSKDAGSDAAVPKKEAGAVSPPQEAGATAPPAPNPGDTCTTENAIFDKSCGFCGIQQAICSKGKVSAYGVCQGSVVNGCTPGTSENAPCGMCGTQQRQCQSDCSWAAGACTGEPANACTPGTTTYTTAGCPTAGEFRSQVCQANCQPGTASECAGPNNALKLQVPAGTAVSTLKISLNAPGVKRPSGCNGSTTSNVSVEYVEVSNPNATAVTVSIYHTKVTSEFDTYIWYYANNLPPQNDTDLKACVDAEDSCSATSPTNACANQSSLMLAGLGGVTIPPNGKILVGSSGYGSAHKGEVFLNVKRQ